MDTEFKEGLNIIIGQNNCGKTTILDAIRLALATGNYQRDIHISTDDFYIDEFGKRRNAIEIDLIFADINSEERGIFLEMFRLNKDGTFALELHIRYTIEIRGGIERIRTKYWGGEKEGNAIPLEVLELFYYAHLEALRNAEERLASPRGNRLGQLFMRLVPGKEEQETHAKKLNKSIKSTTELVGLLDTAEQKINTHLKQITTENRKQKINVDFVPLNFRRIVNGLKIFIPLSDKGKNIVINDILEEDEWEKYFIDPSIDPKKLELKDNIELVLKGEKNRSLKSKIRELLRIIQRFELFQNGLGHNNIIYIATVLGDLLERKATGSECYLALLIEEPEAHLHPQLQNLLFDYFEQIHNKGIQVFITSHSPTITAKTDLNALIVMNHSDNINLTPLRNIRFEDAKHIKYLQRFLDVTKSQLFFADGIIFVEGLSEAILLTVFADLLDKNLDKNGIEVINIGGVAFAPFANLIGSGVNDYGLKNRCAIISDDDRNGDISDRAKKLLELRNDFLEVLLAENTFEYELLKSNEDMIMQIYKQLHPRFDTTGSLDEKWKQLKDRLKSNKDKGEFAQQLSIELEDNNEMRRNFKVPDYIIKALDWVISGER